MTASPQQIPANAPQSNAASEAAASGAIAPPSGSIASEIVAGLPEAWDPFQLMDRLDEEALRREMEGIPGSDLIYVVKEGGQEVVGLSKDGVDACCLSLVAQGQVIREDDLVYELMGEGEGREALFKAKASRYAVAADGTEVKLDQVLGVKRQPLYYEAQDLSLDSRVPSKKYRGKTYRELLASDEGRDYLAWMADNFNDTDIRAFVRALLEGQSPSVQQGRKLNPHWYEHGAMKATRNARFRLIPAAVRAQVIAQARQGGQARVVDSAASRAARPAAGQPVVAQPAAAPVATRAGHESVDRMRREAEERRAIARTSAPAPAPARGEEPAASSAVARATPEVAKRVGMYAPTEKQVAFFRRLAEDSVITDEERNAAMEWLATKATRQSIKDQIDWLKRQVETRRARQRSAA